MTERKWDPFEITEDEETELNDAIKTLKAHLKKRIEAETPDFLKVEKGKE